MANGKFRIYARGIDISADPFKQENLLVRTDYSSLFYKI